MTDLYVGEYLAEDIDAFCITRGDATYFSTMFRGMQNGYGKFHLPIFFFGGIWYARKGMMGRAVILDLLKWTMQLAIYAVYMRMELEQNPIWAILICTAVYQAVLAYKGMDVYWKYVTGYLDKRGLKGRSAVPCRELAESIAKDGDSFKRGVLYAVFFSYLTRVCLAGILLTVYWGWLA